MKTIIYISLCASSHHPPVSMGAQAYERPDIATIFVMF